MKLIKKLHSEIINNTYRSYGLFYCNYCSKEVKKLYYNGLKAKSCGCRKTIHGESRNNISRLYQIWLDMKQRCYNIKNCRYNHYGKKDIIVCKQWRNNYIIFKIWALNNNYKDNLTIDRINNNGNYEPLNCRWVTRKINNRNRPSTKLNIDKANKIRELYNKNIFNQIQLSTIYNINSSHVSKIINNKRWI